MYEVFRTAHEISPAWHVRMQAAFQKYTDNAVSKTINFPESASIDDIREAYITAWKMGCKGITVYRDKSKEVQILETSGKDDKKNKVMIQSKVRITPLAVQVERNKIIEEEERQNVCPECGGLMVFGEGCSTCKQCGYSKCEL
jgi:ribonucleoside-diphosphate reductase alpha chain